ncbi:hypothetical protein CEXT_283261 [Caerostris extrusa]|uniref:Uncharacterized protein n=1 Tax=Caerostris extrusa TaxID=172846 RepID=A0AAV4R4E6_CAEEX|nr:hypothetical protein CEXT_283261 [Caerostris extrusa]
MQRVGVGGQAEDARLGAGRSRSFSAGARGRTRGRPLALTAPFRVLSHLAAAAAESSRVFSSSATFRRVLIQKVLLVK